MSINLQTDKQRNRQMHKHSNVRKKIASLAEVIKGCFLEKKTEPGPSGLAAAHDNVTTTVK